MRRHHEPVGGRHRLVRALSAFAVLLTACVAGPEEPAPTWADVAPRIARSCMPCHAGEQAGPPAFATLDDARRNGRAMALAVEAGVMPPGGVDRSGACQTFSGRQPFGPDDAAILREWVDAGMPGGGVVAPEPVERPVPRADRTVEVELPLSSVSADAHRCFVVDVGADPSYLAGLAVSGPGVVHHAMVFASRDGSASLAWSQDGADREPGWSCPGVPVGAGDLVATWVPGQPGALYPEGAGAVLGTGPLVVQVHQHGAAGEGDVAHVSLFLLEGAEHPVRTVPIAATDFSLPPGEDDVGIARTAPLPFADDVLVLGVMPHLHQDGRAASLRIDGGPCLVDAPGYDFDFQELAFYETPVRVPAGARARLSCRWDTRGERSAVGWGESSDDEMCTVFLFVTDP